MRQEQLYLYNGRIVYACPGMETEAHRHVAAEILVATGERPFVVRHEGQEREYRAAIIGPNTEHELLAASCDLIVFMIDPDSEEFRFFAGSGRGTGIRELDPTDLAPLQERLASLHLGQASCAESYQLLSDLLASVAELRMPPRQWDQRILRVLDIIHNTENLSEVSVYRLAEAIGVSDNRLMHLFKQHIGLPLRRYLLWLRVRRVALMIKDGVNITEAAYAAGFADTPHLSRTFKEMFGVPPTFFLNTIDLDCVRLCDVESG